MLDVGWQELFIIAVITIIVVGPKEIPTVLRSVMSWVRRIKEMAREFQSGIDDIARESELNELRQEIENTANIDLDKEIENVIDPDGEMSSGIYDLEKASEELTLQQEELSQRQEELIAEQEKFMAMRSESTLEEFDAYTPPDEDPDAVTPDSETQAAETSNLEDEPVNLISGDKSTAPKQ
ncbi:MAG: twin-arginine translocase subunit TatB [Rhodospirillaceae bacterium]|jgi:sec-independent protein translocase protein TatB|nr:twin-arginine translocase subunit TatB [Rhodospirillaceae bacterium]MBT5665988.1 twin-arginine translocase subunit TatB [Rhodospirillaceae bacterium]MBT5808842.1 twin-arginine translocase subunit TatB [Rhodospirillaceae bacterium]